MTVSKPDTYWGVATTSVAPKKEKKVIQNWGVATTSVAPKKEKKVIQNKKDQR